MFHYGWVPKSEIPELANNIGLYREVESALASMGYDLYNPAYGKWYIARLKKEFDHESFEKFYRRNRDLTRRHMALLLILYCKLILPKRLGHVEQDVELDIDFDELNLKFGEKFKSRRLNPEAMMKSLLKPLKKYYFVEEIVRNKQRIYHPGPALYMLRDDLLMDSCEAVLNNFAFGADNPSAQDTAQAEEVVDD